jgi:5-methylthioribose kinase
MLPTGVNGKSGALHLPSATLPAKRDGDMDADLQAVAQLVRRWGLVADDEAPQCSVLGGGVSNLVIKVQTKKGAVVVKQALGQLRVQDEWLADRSRIFREVACLRALRQFVGDEVAPEVLREDREHFACVMECAPDGSKTWKQDLLAGIVNPTVTEKVATILATLHRATLAHHEVQETFGDLSNFIELRVDPYFVTIAQRHPDLRPHIETAIEPLLSLRRCLVHGDYSPKNLLLLPDGRIWVLDCEVAHFGNPAFDIAFCTNHLLLKSIHLKSPDHLREAGRLWRSYWTQVALPDGAERERDAVRTLAMLMLARVDGKSPVEYLTDEGKQVVRQVSRQLIADGVDDFETVRHAVAEAIGQQRQPVANSQ